jgi:hypothetical protein
MVERVLRLVQETAEAVRDSQRMLAGSRRALARLGRFIDQAIVFEAEAGRRSAGGALGSQAKPLGLTAARPLSGSPYGRP